MRYTELEEAAQPEKPTTGALKLVKVRDQPGFRERGEGFFKFTYTDIAKAAGLSRRSVEGAATQRKGGPAPELDPNDFESVIRFIMKRRSRE